MDTDLLCRKLIENSHSGIMLLDEDYKIIFRSPSAERIDGWPTENLLKTVVLELIYPDERQWIDEILYQVMVQPGSMQTCTFRLQHSDGHYIWLECVYTHLLLDAEKSGVVCNFIDISSQKLAENNVKILSEQISELLQSMSDGFMSLDEDLRFTYLNKQIVQTLNQPAESLIGKQIWAVFPDMVGSKTYKAVEMALNEKLYVQNEDFYPARHLWYENRVYPSGSGVSIFIRDITAQKNREHHQKLLESVIVNTTDSVMITEAEPFDEPEPRILFVNEAFTRMTGYTAEEVIGKSPRLLQGPKTDKLELKRLKEAMCNWQTCEATLLNYKKNGDEFWLNFALSPVADEKGCYTHWIAIERDVTQSKNEALQMALLSDISVEFNATADLTEILNKITGLLARYGGFEMAEIWLVSVDKKSIDLTAKFCETENMQMFYAETEHLKGNLKDEGLAGKVWAQNEILYRDEIAIENAVRKHAVKKAGINSAYGIPLLSDNIVIGVLLIGFSDNRQLAPVITGVFETLITYLGTDIRRKQIEQELNQIFTFVPNIICTTGMDGFFKKINPALSSLLEYPDDRLLSTNLFDFMHPDDKDSTLCAFENVSRLSPTFNIENRFITQSGKVKWIAWTSRLGEGENLLFSVGKDITEKMELKDLLNRVTNLAQIGGWEIDVNKQTLYWSDITKAIREVAADFEPNLDAELRFFRESETSDHVAGLIAGAIKKAVKFDVEVQITTGKNRLKWVRIIGEPEFLGDQCTRIYGSFQDVDARVKAEIAASESLKERNIILESIDDAFFAVDNNWIVDYWNKAAVNALGKTKHEMLNFNLWDVFADAVDSVSYLKYHQAIENKQAVHFEDYYPALDRWYEISAYPSLNGLAVYFKDISGRKQSEKERLNYISAIEEQNLKLREISWIQSHIIRAPLARILGLVSLLVNSNENPEDRLIMLEYLQMSANQLDEVIRNIIEITEL